MKGWGVIVKNIEIREIKVLSPQLQEKLQAEYKIYQNY